MRPTAPLGHPVTFEREGAGDPVGPGPIIRAASLPPAKRTAKRTARRMAWPRVTRRPQGKQVGRSWPSPCARVSS